MTRNDINVMWGNSGGWENSPSSHTAISFIVLDKSRGGSCHLTLASMSMSCIFLIFRRAEAGGGIYQISLIINKYINQYYCITLFLLMQTCLWSIAPFLGFGLKKTVLSEFLQKFQCGNSHSEVQTLMWMIFPT